MDHEHKLRDWILYRLHFCSENKRYDDRLIECNLIKAMSDMREKELNNLNISPEFQRIFVQKLNAIEMENENFFNRIAKYFRYQKTPGFLVAFSISLVAILLVGQAIRLDSRSQPPLQQVISSRLVKKIAKVPIHILKEHNSKEKDLLNNLEKNPNDREILKQLEVHYLGLGNQKMASTIQYRLEKISK